MGRRRRKKNPDAGDAIVIVGGVGAAAIIAAAQYSARQAEIAASQGQAGAAISGLNATITSRLGGALALGTGIFALVRGCRLCGAAGALVGLGTLAMPLWPLQAYDAAGLLKQRADQRAAQLAGLLTIRHGDRPGHVIIEHAE